VNLEEKRSEFFSNVWDHTQDPFQTRFDIRRLFTDVEIQTLLEIHRAIHKTQDDEQVAQVLRESIGQHGHELTSLLLQLSGLTRTKIISDLKASYVGHKPSSYKNLHRSESWQSSGPYLARSLRRVFQLIIKPDQSIFEALNQATYPGFIRQERAKRQGHEAEYRLAQLLLTLDIPFEPKGKAENPLCRDVEIHGESFDVVIPSAATPLMVVKSTVHTANIGQYGESKDAGEIERANVMLSERFVSTNRPILFALVDGVGYSSNSVGLNSILETVDEFCQFRTFWKAVVVIASLLKYRIELSAKEGYWEGFQPFLNRYAEYIQVKSSLVGTEAGDAYVRVIR
jgi:hypothetical protein